MKKMNLITIVIWLSVDVLFDSKWYWFILVIISKNLN